MFNRRCTWMIAFVTLAITAAALAFPKPAAVPYRWELNFESGPLRLYVDNSSEAKQAYWYFTYTVTNRTGRDQLWAPNMVLFTDSGEILSAGRDVPTKVTQDLLELLGNPLLEDQNQIIGDLLQGRENAREGLVIWKATDTQVNELSLFVRGISGETARVKNPVTNGDVTLYKTLQRNYLVPGEALARGSQPIELVEEQWILR